MCEIFVNTNINTYICELKTKIVAEVSGLRSK